MFSGIIEEVGTIATREPLADGVRLTVGCHLVRDGLRPGDSLALDGVCQTVVAITDSGVTVEAVGDTLRKTTLGELAAGSRVNLERALAVGTRLSGHFVQGHVNGTGTVRDWRAGGAGGAGGDGDDRRADGEADNWYLEVEVPAALSRYIVPEGSLTVDGVSLTVARIDGPRVGFTIIPYTAQHTALRDRGVGAHINIEVDMIARYLEQLTKPSSPAQRSSPPQRGADASGPPARASQEPVGAAIAALGAGKMIIVTDHVDRENEGDLVILAERAAPEAVNFMVTYGRGLVCVALSEERAAALALPPMAASNNALHGTAFTVSVDLIEGTSTGTSAADRAATIRALADARLAPDAFARPGHVFPIIAHPGGVAARPGHTEAAVALAQLAGAQPVAVICEIMADDGEMARGEQLAALAARYGLPVVSVADVAAVVGDDATRPVAAVGGA